MNAALHPVPFGDLPPGTVVDGLTLDRKIGEGGMANLYLAHGPDGRERVLKIPRQSLGTDPVSLVAFENELRLAPYLRDFPHACMPTAWDEHDQYLVMDYIPGVDLWSHLKQHGPLPETDAVALARKVATALAALHQRRILHLDIKLSNIMLTPAGEVRLVDFGLAKHLDLPDLIYDSFHEPKGTPDYIAPEQFIGIRDDVRSDVYSFGTLLFELTTGKLPFPESSSRRDVQSRLSKSALSPRHYNPSLSRHLERVVLTCLHPNPEHRYPDMQALAGELEAWAHGVPAELPADPCDTPRPSSPLHALTRSVKQSLGRVLSQFSSANVCPVRQWAVERQTSADKPYRILAALTLDDDNNDTLNLAVIRETYRLATLRPSRITFMTALTTDVGMMSGDKELEMLNELALNGRRRIKTLLRQTGHRGNSVAINVMVGNPLGAVQDCAEHYDVDLVVIGCRPRRGLSGFIHGQTGYKLLTSLQRNVYVVHAESLPGWAGSAPEQTAAAG